MRLATKVSEALAMPGSHAPGPENAAGRRLAFASPGHLAYAAGISAGGLRTSAWIGEECSPGDVQALAQAVRNLQPMVVAAKAAHFRQLAGTGAFVLFASNAQELLDFTLVAHRIAELALIPGVVIYHIEVGSMDAVEPDGQRAMAFLGDPGERITCPTPAQQILFGKTRRRIPWMFNPDVPVLSGARKSDAGRAYEGAAYHAYIRAHLDAFVSQAFDEFEKHSGRAYRSFEASDTSRADLILCSDNGRVQELASALRSKVRIGTVRLVQWAPLPAALPALAEKARAVAMVEKSTDGSGALFSALCEAFAGKAVVLHSGLYVKAPSKESLQAFVDHLDSGQLYAAPYWLDLAFNQPHSVLPKRQVVLEQLRRAYPLLEQRSAVRGQGVPPQALRMPERVPMALRRYKGHGPVYARLSNFFDQTAFFYETSTPEWTADPFQALPVAPPATAGFGQAAAGRSHIPVLDEYACTACGDCFVHCPHAAIPPLALDLEAFLTSGMQQARVKGHAIAQIVPHVKGLAKAANKEVALLQTRLRETGITGQPGPTIGGILMPAFENYAAQAKLEGEKRDLISRELQAIVECIGAFRVVVAGAFFNDAAQSLFSLAIDPNACTGCGICVDVCRDRALHLTPYEGPDKEAMRQQFALWEQLPDTPADTIQRLLDDPEYASTAALMLSRNFYMSLTGATEEDSNPAKTIVHIAASVAEAAVQPGFRALLKEIDEKSELIASRLKKMLSEALPDASSQVMAERLEHISSERVTIEELLEHSTGHAPAKLLDKALLQRKTELLKELADLKALIETGAGGTGRSRYGIVLDASLSELAAFPLNSFTAPVACFDGDSVEMAQGLVHAHLRHVIDNLKVLRRATLEADNQYNPAIHDAAIAALGWEDLSDTERSFIPPVLLIARPTLLHRQGEQSLVRLLGEGLPVKAILLDDANPSIATAPADILHAAASATTILGLRQVQVCHSSLADPEHLFECLISALGKPGSAFLRLLAPAGVPGNRQLLHELAQQSRAFPHLDYRPDRRNALLFSKLHIDNNPAPDAEWHVHALGYQDHGEEKQESCELTRADWAFAQPDRRPFFEPWQERMGEAMPVAAYLRLNAHERKGKMPVIVRVNASGERVYYAVGEPVVRETEATRQAWMLLREMAGALAEFPEKVYAKAENDLRVQYDADRQKLVDDYEARLKSLEQEHMERIRLKMRDKLLRMTGVNP